jgi:hypothetical protein
MDDARVKKSRIDIFSPKRAAARTERLDPRATE